MTGAFEQMFHHDTNEELIVKLTREFTEMAINVTKLTDAVTASIAKTEALLTENTALKAQLAAAGDPAADQAAVDAQADALAAETSKT